MPTQRRLVIYRAARRAGDEEILSAIEAATGLERATLVGRLKSQTAVYLPPLDEPAAAELQALFRARGIDHDSDPYPASADRVEWLAGEIPKWLKRGLIGPYLLAGLYKNYGLEPPDALMPASQRARAAKRERDPRFLVRAVLTIGAVLVGLGLILFIASNWQRIPAPAKIVGALVLTLAALHLGYRLRFVHGPRPKLSATLFAIALFGIGGVVILIAQIYHVLSDAHVLPLLWGLLCLPVALLLRFKPALYFASALWLWSYWLYPESHESLPWYYAVLLLGFLLPYSIAIGDKVLYWVHVGVLLLALASTPVTQDFWLCTAWVAGLAVLAYRDRRALYDWLLAAGFFFLGVNWVLEFKDVPNVFYALPLAWFFYRAWKRNDNGFLLATVAHALLWWFVLRLQLIDRFDLGEPTATGLLLGAIATGVLVYGAGASLVAEARRPAALALRVGGAALSLVGVYAMSFRFYQEETEFFESSLLLFAALTSFALGCALVWWGGRGRESHRRDELVLLALLAIALGLSAALSPALGVHVVLFNLILFAAALLFMFQGHRRQSLFWYNLGIGLFVVLIITRYFDTFVDLLPRSVFFLLGGVFLIGWAILVDRQRRRRAADSGPSGGAGPSASAEDTGG